MLFFSEILLSFIDDSIGVKKTVFLEIVTDPCLLVNEVAYPTIRELQ